MIKDLSVLQISMLDMVKAAMERFLALFPGRTPKYFYAPEPILHLIAKALEDSGAPSTNNAEAIQVFGMGLCYAGDNRVTVSDLTAKEINAALMLQSWETEGHTKQ